VALPVDIRPRVRRHAGGSKTRVDARLAAWSEDRAVRLFWFHRDDLLPGRHLDGIVAYDMDGNRL
jgi:hypothetical protein